MARQAQRAATASFPGIVALRHDDACLGARLSMIVGAQEGAAGLKDGSCMPDHMLVLCQ